MDMLVFPDQQSVAVAAADIIEAEAHETIRERGQFSLAVSGGSTPWRMLTELSRRSIQWDCVQLFQVDERIVPLDDSARNWAHVQRSMLSVWQQLAGHVHAMPVEHADPIAGARQYEQMIMSVVGPEVQFDLVHLGLGADGHTASLVPGDAALEQASYIAVTGVYQGHRRMTLTFPAINQARRRLWVVAGAEKHVALNRLLGADMAIPASRILDRNTTIITDKSAATGVG